MSTVLSPLVSEFETVEQDAEYVKWLAAKVQACIDDPRPNTPHDKVMAEANALLQTKKKIRAAN